MMWGKLFNLWCQIIWNCTSFETFEAISSTQGVRVVYKSYCTKIPKHKKEVEYQEWKMALLSTRAHLCFETQVRKQNQVLDALSRHVVLLTTMKNEVVGFDLIKGLYEFDNDCWKIVEQLRNPIMGNMDYIQGEYFMQDGYQFKGK